MNEISSGSCSLIIRGDKLDFDEINDCIGVLPTTILKRGGPISKGLGVSEYDVWIFKVERREDEDINDTLYKLLMTVLPWQRYINKLTCRLDVCIRCYIQTDFAQLQITYLSEVIQKLAELNIRFEISILSWGGVDNG